MFFRFSYVDDPQLIPGPFGGVADGGGFQQGDQTAKSDQSALAWTHVFSPSLVNVARAATTTFTPRDMARWATRLAFQRNTGFRAFPSSLKTEAFPPSRSSGLSTLGSNAFLPSDEVSDTIQVTDDFTKIYRQHSFKMGIEFQNVKFSTLQPAYSRGDFEYNNNDNRSASQISQV